MTMRILHCPIEIAGQVGLSVRGLRERNHYARSAFANHPFQYENADLQFAGGVGIREASGRSWLALRTLGRYDVYHYHFGQSLLPSMTGHLDARLNRRLGRIVVPEFWGSDVRIPSVEAARNPFYVNARDESDSRVRSRIRRWAEISHGRAIVSDHSLDAFLSPFFPDIHVIRQRVDCERLPPSYPDPEQRKPVLVHAPSNRDIKGTPFVRRAVERLRRLKLSFDYVEVFNHGQREAFELYAKADLVIDQLCLGSHGVFAVEAMSLGKPVIGHILSELAPTYPVGLPIIVANPTTIESVLEEWLSDPEKRQARGVASRRYVEQIHDYRIVAARLESVYERLRTESAVGVCTTK